MDYTAKRDVYDFKNVRVPSYCVLKYTERHGAEPNATCPMKEMMIEQVGRLAIQTPSQPAQHHLEKANLDIERKSFVRAQSQLYYKN